jgi:uncharacterized membrane protein
MHNPTRPRITLSLSTLDKRIELLSKIFVAALWMITLFAFYHLPKIIPTHFNSKGQVDDYGNKLSILILPIIATVIYLGLTLLNKYPHLFNYATIITAENAHRQYTFATRMLRYLKLAILIIFSGIVLLTYLTSKGITNGLGGWFLPLCLLLVFVPTMASIYFSAKKDKGK